MFMSQGATGTHQIAESTPLYTAPGNFADRLDASATGSVLTLHSKNQPGRATVHPRFARDRLAVVANTSGRAAAPLYTTAPSTLDIPTRSAPDCTVQGYTGPYTASSSKPSVAKATVNGDKLSIVGVTWASLTLW